MSLTLDELREEVLALPVEQRLDLADTIYTSVEPFGLHPEWETELDRRSEELRTGIVKGIPAEDADRELDELVDHP